MRRLLGLALCSAAAAAYSPSCSCSRPPVAARCASPVSAFWDKKDDDGKMSREDALDTLMGAGFFVESNPDADDGRQGGPQASTEIPSHMTIEKDENGEPLLARFTYVDEDTCIGCKNCAFVAPFTFFMEESFAGKARVFNQHGNGEELVDEAIDSCPVNCIHYVSHEDLVTLEGERLERADNIDFNNYAAFKRGWTGQEVAVPETKAKYYGSLAMGTRCNNCPSRGCAQCPMFGVGQNPIYLRREAEREERKKKSGQFQREKEDRERRDKVSKIFEVVGDEAAEGYSPFDDDAFGAIFDEGYSFESMEGVAKPTRKAGYSGQRAKASSQMVPGSVTSEAEDALRDEINNPDFESIDPYAVLGIKKRATQQEVKRAFRRMAMRWHPDRLPTDMPEVERLQAELIFKQINLANEVLTDEAKRRQYDAGTYTSISDLVGGFWDTFKQRMNGRGNRSDYRKGVVVRSGREVSLKELAKEEAEDSGVKEEDLGFLLGPVVEEE